MVLLRCVGWSRDDILTFIDFGPNLLRTRKPNCVVDLYDARQIIALCLPGWERTLLQHLGGIRTPKLQPPRYSRLNNGSRRGRSTTKNICRSDPLIASQKANKPIRKRSCPKFVSFSLLRPPSFAVQEEGGEGKSRGAVPGLLQVVVILY